MAAQRDVEMANIENVTDSTSTVWNSDADADADDNMTNDPKGVDEYGNGEPDLDHEEVEQMDEGHLDDLVRQHVRFLTPPTHSNLSQFLTEADHNIIQRRASSPRTLSLW